MVERSVSYEKSRNTRPKLLRGVRIVLTGGLILPLLAACAPPPNTSIPEPTPASASNSELFYQDNLVLNNEGLPVRYMLEDGTVGSFDVNQVREMRQKAISSGEFQVLAMFRYSPTKYSDAYYQKQPPDTGSKEHPVLLDLPRDVLSEEKLAANGVQIINTDNTSLYIRKQAFEEGGPLAELAGKGGSEKLTIVLVDGPAVARVFLEGNPKYAGVIDLLPNFRDNVNEYRLEKVKELKAQLELLREKFNNATEMAANYSGNQHRMLALKEEIYAYETGVITDKQVLEEKAVEDSPYIAGKYVVNGTSFNPEVKIGSTIAYKANPHNDRTIFVAVGRPGVAGFTKKVVYFDPNGNVFLDSDTVAGKSGKNFTPDSSESYPDPKNYRIDPKASPDDPNAYLIGASTAGFVLRHEVEHDVKIAQAIIEGKEPDYSEYNTDNETALGLGKASKKWVESEYTDNSGYYYVFRLRDGRYILTWAPKLNKALGLIA